MQMAVFASSRNFSRPSSIRRSLLCLLSVSGAAASKQPLAAIGKEFADYCVTSKWGYTCFSPDGVVMRGVKGPAAQALVTVLRRSVLVVTGTAVAREVLRDVRSLNGGLVAEATLPNAVVRPPTKAVPGTAPAVSEGSLPPSIDKDGAVEGLPSTEAAPSTASSERSLPPSIDKDGAVESRPTIGAAPGAASADSERSLPPSIAKDGAVKGLPSTKAAPGAASADSERSLPSSIDKDGAVKKLETLWVEALASHTDFV